MPRPRHQPVLLLQLATAAAAAVVVVWTSPQQRQRGRPSHDARLNAAAMRIATFDGGLRFQHCLAPPPGGASEQQWNAREPLEAGPHFHAILQLVPM